jgi:serine/threonine protein kinase
VSRATVYRSNSQTVALEAGQTVAVKVVPAVDKETVSKLKREITWLAECSSPFITSFFVAHKKENDLWIVMEFCNAGSLARLLKQQGKGLAEPLMSAILYQVVGAVEYLHKSLLLHRDVKADNILLTTTGAAKLADLGVAHKLQNKDDTCATATGTPYWMAPELIVGQNYSFPVDVWSLGVTAIEMADTRPPLFEYLPQQALFLIGRPDHKPTVASPSLFSAEFLDFIARCCAHDPSQRSTAMQLSGHAFLADGPRKQREHLAVFLTECVSLASTHDSSENTSRSSWSIDHLGVDHRVNEHEMHCELFAQCEDCFYVPEKEPWLDDVRSAFDRDPQEIMSPRAVTEPLDAVGTLRRPASPVNIKTVEVLFNLMLRPSSGVPLGSRYHRFRRFKDAFLGAEAVSWIMKQVSVSRAEAIVVAQEFLRRQFILNVVDQSTLFHENAIYTFSAQHHVRQPEPIDLKVVAETVVPSLKRIRARRFDNVGFLGRTYTECFLGTDVIDLIMNEVRLNDRNDAEGVARMLLSGGHIQPVLPSTTRPEFDEAGLYKRRNLDG